ncbi:MAG: M15 family metallopeptidase [Eubacteriales bacterium]|nr:M15 family metallopeptidase [Eubacteriales bacterium]
MRKNIRIKMTAAILMAAVTVCTITSCGKKQAADADNQMEVPIQTSKEATADQESENREQSTENMQTKVESENAVGVSTKGYTIEKIDGVTYVNGIMIVNKTYPLPSSYNPGGLSGQVLDAFAEMQADAAAAGLNIWIQSSFRTYEYQDYLYNMYVSTDGKAAADTYSARPGFSEHQSGLCFDLNSIDDSFTNTPEGRWVDANAHKYGFIIRFPLGKEDITGYKYESWHLRYVGEEIATYMYNNNMCLEEYLGVTSQYEN